MSDPGRTPGSTPIYHDVVAQFQKRGIDIREIANRERWSLQAAKRRLKVKEPVLPKSRA